MSINAAKSGLGVRGCEQLWLVVCFSPCHLRLYIESSILANLIPMQAAGVERNISLLPHSLWG